MNHLSKNPYETGNQKVIPAVLLYAFYEDSLLMIHRDQKKNDIHEGKWNGLGGKLELGETPVEAAVREFHEEAHALVPVEQWKWLGQLYFPNFKPHKKEDWWVNVWFTDLTEEQAMTITSHSKEENPEGTLHFIEQKKVMDLNLWEGDRHFIPLLLDRIPFNGTFFYENGKCVKHELDTIFGHER